MTWSSLACTLKHQPLYSAASKEAAHTSETSGYSGWSFAWVGRYAYPQLLADCMSYSTLPEAGCSGALRS